MSRTPLGPAAVLAAVAVTLAGAPLAGASTFDGPGADPNWTRGTVVAPGLTPPATFAPIGVADDVIDAGVADVGQVRVVAASPAQRLNLAGGPELAHGTEVASVAAARGDGQGVVGIAPGAPLLSYGYQHDDPSCSDIADGVLALAEAGAKVVNVSMETDPACEDLQLAVAAASGDGVVVVASAGNSGRQGSPTTYPASYPHVLTVGALDSALALSAFTTAGPGVDVAAPGENVPVSLPVALDRDGTADGLTRASGTSFSAPIVAGAVAWLMAARPRLSAGQYGDLLRASARDVGPAGWDAKSGFGLVDLAAALAAPTPPVDRGEPNDGIDFVDGTDFAQPDPYVSGTIKATISPVEDPVDVYRVRVKARARLTATLTGGRGAHVQISTTRVKTLPVPPTRGRTRVTVHNRSRRPATYYVAVDPPGGAKRLATSSAYTLKLARG